MVEVVPAVAAVIMVLVVVKLVAVWAAMVIGTFVKVLAVGMRADTAIIVLEMAVGIDASTALTRGVLTNVDAGAAVEVNVNVFADMLANSEFIMTGLSKFCWRPAAFDCR